jgi:hypothetical protein
LEHDNLRGSLVRGGGRRGRTEESPGWQGVVTDDLERVVVTIVSRNEIDEQDEDHEKRYESIRGVSH